MATIRFSLGPSEPSYSTIQAAGSAVVSKPIEVTTDFDGMIAGGMSATLARNAALDCLTKIAEFIENGAKGAIPG